MSLEDHEPGEETPPGEIAADPAPEDLPPVPALERGEAGFSWGRRLVLGAVALVVAGAWFGVRRFRRPAEAAAAVGSRESERKRESSGGAGAGEDSKTSGTVTVTIADVALSPAAKIQAEKFKCVCGCGMSLAECTCQQTPGSVDMKQHLQGLVNQGLAPSEIERAMVERYGPQAIP